MIQPDKEKAVCLRYGKTTLGLVGSTPHVKSGRARLHFKSSESLLLCLVSLLQITLTPAEKLALAHICSLTWTIQLSSHFVS